MNDYEVKPVQKNRIRELREDNDLTQKYIASLLSVAQNTYSNYESGKREIPISQMIRLADYYKVNMDYLLGRTDQREMLPPSRRMDFWNFEI